MTEFIKPSVEYFELWPLLVVFGVACLGVVVEAFVPRRARYTAQVALALVGLVGALVGAVVVARDVTTYDDGAARGVDASLHRGRLTMVAGEAQHPHVGAVLL